jgi:hypothetical protein
MQPRAQPDSPDLGTLRIDLLRQAVAVYLGLAYPATDPPEVVRKRLDWPAEVVDAGTLLASAPFERANRSGSGLPLVCALRLGNARYPHMKLQIQPWPNAAGFMLSVNTHDQVHSLEQDSSEAQAFRALQAENQALKEAIELAWDHAGLPTFLRYLRDYINDPARSAPPADTGPG